LTGEKEVKSNNQMVANVEVLCKLAVGKTAMAATELLHREKKSEAPVHAASTLTTPWC